uniref:G6b-B extracellular V-set Ig-like domain-containing protein n=1 Tax=Pelusios castaneus TaxID=367368 RepID=A0A8C8VFR9_9SAUR
GPVIPPGLLMLSSELQGQPALLAAGGQVLLSCGAVVPPLRWVWSPQYPDCAGVTEDLPGIAQLSLGPEVPPGHFGARLAPHPSILGALLLRDLVMSDSGIFLCLGMAGAHRSTRLEVMGGEAGVPAPFPPLQYPPLTPICPHRLPQQPHRLLRADIPLHSDPPLWALPHAGQLSPLQVADQRPPPGQPILGLQEPKGGRCASGSHPAGSLGSLGVPPPR